MTHRSLRNIHTTRNSCRDAVPCANMALKLPQYFYLLMEKAFGRYFQVRSPYYQVAQCNQKNTYSYILKVTGQVLESQKRISVTLITATTSIHLPKSVSTDLTIKPYSVSAPFTSSQLPYPSRSNLTPNNFILAFMSTSP